MFTTSFLKPLWSLVAVKYPEISYQTTQPIQLIIPTHLNNFSSRWFNNGVGYRTGFLDHDIIDPKFNDQWTIFLINWRVDGWCDMANLTTRTLYLSVFSARTIVNDTSSSSANLNGRGLYFELLIDTYFRSYLFKIFSFKILVLYFMIENYCQSRLYMAKTMFFTKYFVW